MMARNTSKAATLVKKDGELAGCPKEMAETWRSFLADKTVGTKVTGQHLLQLTIAGDQKCRSQCRDIDVDHLVAYVCML